MSDNIRSIDCNGHMPEDQAPDDYGRGWRAGYNQAIVDFLTKLGPRIGQLADQLEALHKKEPA